MTRRDCLRQPSYIVLLIIETKARTSVGSLYKKRKVLSTHCECNLSLGHSVF